MGVQDLYVKSDTFPFGQLWTKMYDYPPGAD